MAVHLFILYWAMLSFITPPVALGAFAAASIAKSPPLLTGLTAMRLGSIIYFIPFVFVLEPSLVLEGDLFSIVLAFAEALVGIWLIAGAIQGFLPLVGGTWSWWTRWLSGLGGFLIALPSLEALFGVGATNGYQALAGAVLVASAFGGRFLAIRGQVAG